MNRARALYQLQVVEIEIEQKNRRLAQVQASIKETDELRVVKEALEKAQKRLQELRSAIHNLELENQGLQSEISSAEKELYGGHITNPKELASLENKIKNLKARRAKLEDDLLEKMLAAEEAEETLKTTQTHFAQVEAEWQSNQAALVEERDRLIKEISRAIADRASMRQAIPPTDLATYDHLCRRKGQAVARIVDGACRGCGVAVPSRQMAAVHEGDQLILCGSCERILYAER